MVTCDPHALGTRARLGDRLLGFLGVRLVIWLIAAKAFVPGVLFDPVTKIGSYHDEHNVIMHEEVARKAIGDYHQLPAWNPYFCGGIIELSNAPSNALAPDMLLRVLYGTLAGRRLAVLLFIVLGMEGTFRYARRNGASALGGALAGIAFSTSGHFVSLLGWGWIFMFNYNLVPWCALSFEEGLRKRWWIVAGGFFIAWLVLGGATYVLPYTGIVLLLLLIGETVRAALRLDGDQSLPWWRPAAVLLAMGVIAAGLSAIRLLPLLDLLVSHARPVHQKDQTGPISIITSLAVPREHGAWGAGAGDYYVGAWVFLLAVLALLFSDKKAAKMWFIAVLFGALACGEFVEHAPYVYLRKLPVMSQLRFPGRMVTISGLFVALAGGIGLTRLEDALLRTWHAIRARVDRLRSDGGRQRPSRLSAFGVPALAFAIIAAVAVAAGRDVIDHNVVRRGSIYVMDAAEGYDDEFRQARGNRWDAHVWPFANRGSLHCFEEHELFQSPYLRGDLAHDEYGAPETDTTVERISWSPHRIVLRVKSTGPGRFLVNQNHARAWKTDVGEVGSDGGLISVKVPAGEHVVTLTYSDWKIWLGALLSVATLAAIGRAAVPVIRRRLRRLRAIWERLS